MAISKIKVGETFLNIVANTPISCDWPLYAEDECFVYYGQASLEAALNVDFTVTLDPPNYNTFSVNPLPALLTKINDLIAANPTEEFNYITIRRTLEMDTSVLPESVRLTAFVSREFERTIMRFQQLEETLKRCLKMPENVAADSVDFVEVAFQPGIEPGHVPITNEDGTRIVQGPTVADVTAAQANAALALQYRDEARDARDDILGDAGFIAVSSDLLGDDTIGIVAAQIAAVVTCATNIAAILDAPTQAAAAAASATLAQQWATSLSVVSGGLYGARYYAQLAATFPPSSAGNTIHAAYMADGAGASGWRVPQEITSAQVISTTTDLNTITSPGMYRLSNANTYPNNPLSGYEALLEVLTFPGTSNIIQILYPSRAVGTLPQEPYYRRSGSSTWTSWGRFALDQPSTWASPQRAGNTAVAYAATVTLDLSQSNNFTVGTLTGNITLAAPTNQVVGQSGSITFVQDATGGRNITYNAAWKFANGVKTPLNTAANAVSKLYYEVRGSNLIDCTVGAGMS